MKRTSAIVERLVGLIRDTSSRLPDDVLAALKKVRRKELKGSSAAVVLQTILDNCQLAAKKQVPLCQDTGTLAFYVEEKLRHKITSARIKEAVAIATDRGYLRKNCIDAVTGKSYDDNVCEGAPVIHYVSEPVGVTLLLKGGGSENMSRQYSLPSAELKAGRDLEGVRKCVLDAVRKIQGYGCAPGILGVCIGGDRASAYAAAKAALLRPIGERNRENKDLAKLEARLLKEANVLGIGPMGLGGKTTLLDVKLTQLPRVPASFFVTIAYMCWACRRQTLVIA